jgi:hypothetical protein
VRRGHTPIVRAPGERSRVSFRKDPELRPGAGSVLDAVRPSVLQEGRDDGWRHYTVTFSKGGLGVIVMANSSNAEGIYKELLETVLRNTFTPIEWEGFAPYDRLPPRTPQSE